MDTKSVKQQRDRFLAFAFASADLFLEVGADGFVTFATGAAQSLTGIDSRSLIGQNWLALFADQDVRTMKGMYVRMKSAERCGPFLVKFSDRIAPGQKAILTSIKMPGSKKIYLTLGFPNALVMRAAESIKKNEQTKLLDKESFVSTAREALNAARSQGQDLDMTLLDIENAKDIRQKMGDEWWGRFTESVTDLLCTESADGQAAGEIMEGRYSIVHEKTVSADMLREKLADLAKDADPEGKGLGIKWKTINSDLQTLTERDATKALIYTINEFERKGTELNIETLNTGFKTYVNANAHRIAQFKSMIEQLSFDLHFQPIVDLKTREAAHYEMLSRFKGEGSTQEWIMFGEDIGMAADLDIAVCERAINYLLYKSSGHRTKFAVNLSGQSIQNEQFFKTLLAKLAVNKGLSERLIFEITESTNIEQLDMVNHFIRILQEKGFTVCLDDFGAGSASFQYIQKLNVDYVKIDGQYTKKLLTSPRDAVMVRNLAKMCQELNITVVSEMIETQEQADFVRDMGIPLGQGFLFAKPKAKPDYVPPPIKKA